MFRGVQIGIKLLGIIMERSNIAWLLTKRFNKMRIFFWLSIILLQALLSSSSSIPLEWKKMTENNIPDYIDNTPSSKIKCMDDDCREMELLMKSSIKQSVKPCDDFYTHACGEWINRHPLGGRSIIDQYTTIKEDLYKDLRGYLTDNGNKYRSYRTDRKARNFYKSCMKEQGKENRGLQSLKTMVNSNGGWVLTNDNQTKTMQQKWQNVHKKYYARYDLPALFQFQVLPDKRNSSKHILTLSIPFVDIHELSTAKASKRAVTSKTPQLAYRNLIKKIAKTVKHENSIPIKGEKVDPIIDFEKRLEQLTEVNTLSKKNFHHDTSYKVTTIKKIQDTWDTVLINIPKKKSFVDYQINWLETIRNTFWKANVQIVIDDNEPIAIEPGHYIKDLANLLMTTELETIVNYIHWNGIKNMLKYSGNRINRIVNHYNKIVYGAESKDPRWLQCIRDFPLEYFLTARMGHSQDLRIQQNFVAQMFYRIEGAFMRTIEASKLLPKDRNAFIRKFSPHMNYWLQYSDWSRNSYLVSEYYKDLNVKQDNYFKNMVSFNKFMRRKELTKLRMPVDRLTAEWPVSPMDFVAAYDTHTNTVVLPAGLLRHPYMKFYKIPAIQYGSLGMIIGHEMAHSIDSEEHVANGLNSITIPWTLEVSSLYKTIEECYRNEYSGYNIELGTGERLPLDKNLTIREIIADNMGIRMAYLGFKSSQNWTKFDPQPPNLVANFTTEQLFFYSFAQSFCENPSDEYLRNVYENDEHPPSKIRVNGALSRMKEFHDAFQCQQGNPMINRKSKQCSL